MPSQAKPSQAKPYLLTYLLSHSRGTPLSHLHCPVGQLRSRVVGPEYVGHRWWVQGGGKVGRGGGGGGGGVLLLYSPGGLPVGIPVSSPFPVLLLLAPARSCPPSSTHIANRRVYERSA